MSARRVLSFPARVWARFTRYLMWRFARAFATSGFDPAERLDDRLRRIEERMDDVLFASRCTYRALKWRNKTSGSKRKDDA